MLWVLKSKYSQFLHAKTHNDSMKLYECSHHITPWVIVIYAIDYVCPVVFAMKQHKTGIKLSI